MKTRTKIISAIAALFLLAGLFFAFRPRPVPVQTARVSLGPLEETADEEGKTRMHDHFVLAAGVSGKLRRIELHAGDPVHAGAVVAWVDPTPIEPRQIAVLQARLDAARAAQQEADAAAGHAKAENDQATIDLERAQKLFDQGIASREAYDKAVNGAAAANKQLDAAKSKAKFAAYQVEEAHAALLSQPGDHASLPVAIKSPVAGRVLKLLEQSERVVSAGTPIVEIGYTPKLEVVADFLTRDAVKIAAGMEAVIEDWGGDKPLRAVVRMIEPGGFTKISALGVEEQRANVVLDFLDDPDGLGDGYRVQVRVVTWQAAKVIKVPLSSVFRAGAGWAVFTVRSRVARQAPVRLGHRGAGEVEVLEGLSREDTVVVHPSAEVKDGVRVSISHS